MAQQDVNYLVASALDQMKRVDVYSDAFSLFSEMQEENLTEEGLTNSYGLLEFYINLALLANFGGVAIIDTKGSDFKLGFSEFEDLLNRVAEFQGSEGLTINLKTQLKVNNLRNVSLMSLEDEDIEKYLAEDATLVLKSLGMGIEEADVDSKLKDDLSDKSPHKDEELISRLKKSSKLSSIVNNTVEDILEVYDKSLASGYELEKPVAMVIGEPSAPTLYVERDWKPYALRSTASFFFGEAIRRTLSGVELDLTSRQFDLDKIYASNQPVYFPKKIAEFALGYRVSASEEQDVYSQIGKSVWINKSKTGHWKADYSQRNEIQKYLTEYAWEYARVVIEACNLTEHPVILNPNEIMMPDMAQMFTDAYKKFKDSACTFAVLKSQTGDIEQWASAEWSIVAPSSSFGQDPLVAGNKLHVQVFYESGDIEPPLVTEYKGITIKNYRHISNAKVAEAEPLFAYKALQAMQDRGEQVSPSNIVVGKGLNGKLLTSKRGEESDLAMWKNLVHATSSGSRSGKGVQISAQTTPSIAVGRMIFPHDRKPDTAVPFYELAGGADANGTPLGYFIQGGEFSAGNVAAENPNTLSELDWDNNPLIMNRLRKLVPSWWEINSYKGVWGDMAYFRSMLLTLGILCLRAEVRSSNPSLYEQLGGDEGIVILYDEITNFTELFLQKYMNSSKWFSKDVWSKKKANNLRMAIRSLESVKSGSKAEMEAEDVINDAKRGVFKFNVYMRDLINNYNETMDALSAKEKAGFNQQESWYSDVYIVGQSLQITTPDKPRVSFTNTGEVAAFGVTDVHLLSFLYNFQSDFIVGYNETAGASHQAWRKVEGSDSAKYLTETARRFAYLNGVSYEDVRDGKRETVSKANSVFTSREAGAVYFKPYLLLTSDKGKPVEQLEGALGTSAKAVRTNNAKFDANGQIVLAEDGLPAWNSGIGLPEYVRRMSGRSDNLGDSFIKARQVAEMIIQRMGYQGDYLDFLLDLRPEWNFSAQDVVDAFIYPDKYAQNKRISSWIDYNIILNGGTVEEEVDGYSSSDQEVGFGFAPTFNEADDEVNDFDEPEVSFSTSYSDSERTYDDEVVLKPTPEFFETEDTAELTEERVYENHQNWQPRPDTIPVSEEGIDRLANALGIAPDLLMSTYMGIDPNEEQGYQEVKNFNSQKSNSYVNSTSMAFGDLHNQIESVMLNGLRDLMRFITEDVLQQFGGVNFIETVSVKGGILSVNNVIYKPSFPNLDVSGLPVDKRISLNEKRYADLFDFSCLTSLKNITVLEVDSSQFILTRVVRPLGLRESDSVFKLFDMLPTLRELTVGSATFDRAEAISNVTEKESVFKSSRRREQVLTRADERGRNFRRARWDSTKRYWSTATGWKRFTGVSTNLVGAGLGATTQLGAKTVAQTNSLLKSASNLFSIIAKDIKDEFKN